MPIREFWIDRFSKLIDLTNPSGCWDWRAYKGKNKYGSFKIEKETIRANRLVWMTWLGSIPDNFYVLHKCDNRSCVRPDHLFLGTHQDNMDDMNEKGRHPGTNKTHCSQGHELSGANLVSYFLKKGVRCCNECKKARWRVQYHASKMAD